MSEKSEYKRKKNIMVGVAYAALAVAVYVAIFRYFIYVAWPFAIALFIAMALHRPTVFIARKIHISEKLSAAITTALFYVIVIGVVVLIIIKAFWSIAAWASNLPDLYEQGVEPFIEDIFDWYRDEAGGIAGSAYLENLGDIILERLKAVVRWLSNTTVGIAQKSAIMLPKALLGTIFMIISSFFISMDYRRIAHFFMSQLNPNQQQIAVSAKEHLSVSMGKMVVSYSIIMFITFCEMNIGLRILHVANPTVVALVIAIFDILPALGTGGIVIPWMLIELISGDYRTALGLLIIYAAVTTVRNILEPKIVGNRLGVHPVLMLMSIYLGAWLLGPLGIFILPFTIIIIKKLNETGLVHIFNTPDDGWDGK